MKPILNKEEVLRFAETAHKVTKAMPGNDVGELATKIGRMQVISELMDLVNDSI